ncbi:GbsR/MarR family transcriptional regulator [Candidatus Latescibacterota bacterium]
MSDVGLNSAESEFVERIGLAFERLGTSRTAGRLFGVLLMAREPLSLDELSRLLQVSKASVSTNARYDERIGIIERASVPGDRRDYYRVAPRSLERAVTRRVAVTHEFVRLAESGLDAVDEGNGAARERLAEMRDFYQFIGDGLEGLMNRWREGRSG